MAKRNPEPDGTRESIRQTAASLFMTGGVYATSLGDIAKSAGLSKGTLYYHYPTKEHLVLEIAEKYFANVTEAIYNWIDGLTPDSSAQDALLNLTRGIQTNNDTMRLYFALMSEALREDSTLRALICKKQKEWAVMLEVGALKLSGPGAARLRKYSPCVLSLMDGFKLHQLLNEGLNDTLLVSLLTEG